MPLSTLLTLTAATVLATSGPTPSSQSRHIESLVNDAAKLLKKNGRAAFAELRKPDTKWRSGSTYIFAYDLQLNVLFNPAFPQREGTNPRGERDVNGKAMHEEFLKVVRTAGSGWVDYMFPRPGEKQPSRKWSYVRAVAIEGKPAIIGAGFYPE
jgi:signal transduction histidine kinase